MTRLNRRMRVGLTVDRVRLTLNALALFSLAHWPLSEWRVNRISDGVLHYFGDGAFSDAAWVRASLVDPPTLWIAVGLIGVMILQSLQSRAAVALSVALAVFPALLLTVISRAAPDASTRISLCSGFWVTLGLVELSAFSVISPVMNRWQTIALSAAIGLLVTTAVSLGWWDNLSLVREWVAQEDLLTRAVWEHLELSVTCTATAAVVAIPAGFCLHRRASGVGLVLHFIHTIPSLALFGLLMVPLSLLAEAWPALADWGVHGIGVAPAWCALFLYALLPLFTVTVNGLNAIDPAVLEAADGMGFNRWQRLWHIELPLSLPSLRGALSVTLVQMMGLATIAALIGGGGLGTLIFNGIGQNAPDLVLLGTLAVLTLTLVTQILLPPPSIQSPG